MSKAAIVIWLTMLAACAADKPKDSRDEDQAVRDFIEIRNLEQPDKLRSSNYDSWDRVGKKFILYHGRRDHYLVEFIRDCRELDEFTTEVIADTRYDKNTIRARSDTFRGCRIGAIYAIDKAEAAELENLGESPGSRN